MFAVHRRYCRAAGNVVRVIKQIVSLQEITTIDHPCASTTGKRDVFTGRTIAHLFFFLLSMLIDWFTTTWYANSLISKVAYYTEMTLPTIVLKAFNASWQFMGFILCPVWCHKGHTCPILRATSPSWWCPACSFLWWSIKCVKRRFSKELKVLC